MLNLIEIETLLGSIRVSSYTRSIDLINKPFVSKAVFMLESTERLIVRSLNTSIFKLTPRSNNRRILIYDTVSKVIPESRALGVSILEPNLVISFTFKE